jgi:hypothetical protein
LAEIEGLGTLNGEQLNQRWHELFAAERPPRVSGELLIKALAPKSTRPTPANNRGAASKLPLPSALLICDELLKRLQRSKPPFKDPSIPLLVELMWLVVRG